jgi:AbrB family looped-hinge helix DNA binding protein
MNADFSGMTAIVSEKGQVTIPKKLRDSLGLRTGQVLEFVERDGKLVAAKVRGTAPFEALRGVAKLPEWADSVDDFIDQVRGEPEP